MIHPDHMDVGPPEEGHTQLLKVRRSRRNFGFFRRGFGFFTHKQIRRRLKRLWDKTLNVADRLSTIIRIVGALLRYWPEVVDTVSILIEAVVRYLPSLRKVIEAFLSIL